MTEIKIEKGVPIPSKATFGGTLGKTILKMEIGDSFKVPYTLTIKSTIYTVAKKNRKKVTIKSEGDMVRVWVVA